MLNIIKVVVGEIIQRTDGKPESNRFQQPYFAQFSLYSTRVIRISLQKPSASKFQ